MSLSYRHTVLIDSRDVDGHNQCKASALLGHLQEAATRAAESGGFGRSGLLEKYDAFWMLTRVWFHLDRPLTWGEELTIHTWHRGGKNALMYRDYDLYVGGTPVGEAVSAWVLADVTSRHLLRLGAIPSLADTWGGELCKTRLLKKLRMPEDLTERDRRPMRYSDTDLNGHVNNTRYADFACDALRMDLMPPGRYLQEMQLGFLAECLPGEELILEAGGEENAPFLLGRDKNGRARFEAGLRFGKIPA